MNHESSHETRTFEPTEEQWFAEPQRRPSQRPTLPAPAMPAHLDDSIADGWFYDV